jgi:hypothetical protein
MSDTADVAKQNELRDIYIHLGGYADNLNDREHIQITFSDQVAMMHTELFKKEE